MGAQKVIIPLQNGRHFWFVPNKVKGERGLSLKHIASFIAYIAQHYEGPTPVFTEADVIRIVWRLLYKCEPDEVRARGEHLKVIKKGMTLKQLRFIQYYSADAFGNAAKAARLAGYSPRRAKQTAYDLQHERRRY